MRRNGVLSKTIIITVFLLLFLGAFALLSGCFATPQTSDERPSDLAGGSDVTPISDDPTNAYENGAEDLNPSEQAYPYYECPDWEVELEYFTIEMSPYDVFRGNLILVNHEHGFDPTFVPELVYVIDYATPSFRVSRDNIQLAKSIIEPFVQMMDAYYAEIGTNAVSIRSGFRGLERQRELLDEQIARLGSVEARRWVAEPGHSEHHAGLAMDLGFYQDGVLRTFLGVGRTAWFAQNSYNFGFIVRYPYESQHITQVAYEPWHFRYVGLPHSYFINQKDMVLEEYIDFIMTHNYEHPFIAMFGYYEYEVFFTENMIIQIPFDSEFEISGNNINGFIVTVRR